MGQETPMYTEVLYGGTTLALMIPSLTDTMAGNYTCSASYAQTTHLSQSVIIETYRKYFALDFALITPDNEVQFPIN